MLSDKFRSRGRIPSAARFVGLAAGVFVLAGCSLVLGPTPSPTLTSSPLPLPDMASISGRVWDDQCTLPLGESPAPAVDAAGCLQLADGTFQANGLEDTGEPTLAGLQVTLADGACPGTPRVTMTSDADGAFTFTELPPGTYCLTIDSNDPSNVPVLGPGRWTSPVSASLMAQAGRELVLAPGEQIVTQDFGWDADSRHVSTPVPTTPMVEATHSPAGCTDLAGLVQDVSIPPGSSVVAGEAFRKVWRLRNDGTCIWAPDYALVFSSGQAMGGTVAVSFGATVPPGSTIDLALNLVAPTTPGTYRGNWLLRSSRGLLFGTPWSGVNPIWVEVIVTNAGTVGGWKAEYFANRDLHGTPALTRRDTAIDFSWGSGSPDPSLPTDSFSVRWNGTPTFDQAVYRFHLIMDDGARLWVDGKPLIDSWKTGTSRELTQDLGLARGAHSLRLEYFEDRNQASVRLYWEKVSQPSFPDWKAEFWSNVNLSGNPGLVRNDAQVKFDWGMQSPATGVPADLFSARWTRSMSFPAGLYRFSLRADDGVRLYINGTRVLDEWHTADGTVVYTVDRGLSGTNTLRLDYYDGGGAARVELSWVRLSTTLTPSPTATLTPTATLSPTVTETLIPSDTPTSTATP